MARRVFFSFHYKPDNSRAAQVRNIGTVSGNAPVSDNDWEKVKGGGDAAIKKWITAQLNGKSCAVVLAGSKTAGRKWIKHEIAEAWNAGKGVVCIHVNKLKDLNGDTASKGASPLADISVGTKKLSDIAKTYTPGGSTSKDAYDWISKNLSAAVEEAVKIREDN